MASTGSNSQVSIVEIAQQCNVSVRDIHFAAKDLKQPLQPTARTIDGKLAKQLTDFFLKQKEAQEIEDKKREKEEAKLKKQAETEAKKLKQLEPQIKEAESSEPVEKLKKNEFKIITFPKAEKPAAATKQNAGEKYVKLVLKAKPLPAKHGDAGKPPFKKFEPHFLPKPIKKDSDRSAKKKPVSSALSDELLGIKETEVPRDTAEIYDQMIAEEREREIVQSQRKKMAGKEAPRTVVKKAATISQTIKYDPNRVVEVPDVISVKEFAEKSGLGAAKIIGELMKNGILANINQIIDYDTISIIADDLRVKIKRKRNEASVEDIFRGNLASLIEEHDKTLLLERPPIVVVMGHVDHGKTKLLDAIRKTDVVSGEAGGITQHIAAYQVERNNQKITFIDTPGHEAFTAMRARGAKVTDIAVLVVAADEGVKPQTLEALQHAKDANVPIIVAINKMDKPNAEPEKVKGELAGHDLVPEEWGGKTIMVQVSALTKQGIDTLLDMILLQAEMLELKANPNRGAVATVIEGNLDSSLGPIATVIVNTGTLKLMDNVVVGESYGRIKVLKDHHGKNVKFAGPSTPVLIAGLDHKVESGDILHVVPDEKTARGKSIAVKTMRQAQQKERGLGEIMSALNTGKLKTLKLVLKADTNGSLEAIKHSLSDIKHEDVGVRTILSGVGDVSESDVMMAAASGAVVMGFNCKVSANVKNLAERENVEVIEYNIIYKLLDDVKKILTGLLEPEFIEVVLGELAVKMIFFTKKKEAIIGCSVESGKVENRLKFKVKRAGEIIGEGRIESLQKNQDNVHEVKEGNDCGLKVNASFKIEVGDTIEIFKTEKKIRTL